MKRGSVWNRWADRYVGIPVLLATGWARRRRALPEHVRRLGVMTSPTLGDTLLASGVLRDARKSFPDARIVFICSPTNRAAAELLPEVDELLPVKLTEPLPTVRALRAARLDLLLDLSPWQRLTAFYTAASGARYRAGFKTAGQHRHAHYDRVVEHLRTRHEVDNFRALAEAAGVWGGAEPRLHTPWLGERRPSGTIVFHPWASGDRHALREWPVGYWVELAARLNGPGRRFAVTGAPSQRAQCEQFCAALRGGGVEAEPFQGAAGLRGLTELIHDAALLVSVNTGIMHLAAILGAPTVSINGPTSALRWGPRGPRGVSVNTPRGGFLHLGFEFHGQPEDVMGATTVEAVYRAALEVAPELGASTEA